MTDFEKWLKDADTEEIRKELEDQAIHYFTGDGYYNKAEWKLMEQELLCRNAI